MPLHSFSLLRPVFLVHETWHQDSCVLLDSASLENEDLKEAMAIRTGARSQGVMKWILTENSHSRDSQRMLLQLSVM